MKYLAVLLLLLAFSARSFAQCPPQWLEGESVPGLDGSIYSHAIFDPDGPGPLPQVLVMAGSAQVAGSELQPRLWTFDGTTWTRLLSQGASSPPTIYQVNGEVFLNGNLNLAPGPGLWRMTPSGFQFITNQMTNVGYYVLNNQFYAQGAFTIDGVATVRGIARWTGTAWERLGPDLGSTASINYLTSYNGSLVISGQFNLPNLGLRRIARWDGTRWASMGSIDNFIQEAVEHDGSLYVRGPFTNAGNLGIAKLARWNGTAWSAVGGVPDVAINAMRSYAGSLYVAGSFRSIGGVSCPRIARWDGSAWHSLETGLVGNYAGFLNEYRGDLIIGGNFTGAGHLTTGGPLVRWNGTTFLPLDDDAGFLGTCGMVCELNGELIASGAIYSAGGKPAHHIAAWNGETWRPLAPNTGVHGLVYALTQFGDRLYAGGDLLFVGDQPVRGIASSLNDEWSPVGAFGPNGPVSALTVYDNQLIAAGTFTDADGVPASNIARWDGNAWHAMGFGLPGGSVYALTVHAGALIAAHNHQNEDGTADVSEVKTWDGTQWLPLGPEFNFYTFALASNGADLYCAGAYTRSGATPINRIARWDGSNWNPLGSGVNSWVYALAFHNGDLVAGGLFNQAGDQTVGRWARWNGSAWSSIPWFQIQQEPAGAPVYSLVSHNGQLFGGVGSIEAGYYGCIRQWDGGPSMECAGFVDSTDAPFILAMTMYNNRLVMGGTFSTVNQHISFNVAQAWFPSSDFNADGDFGTDADIQDFFACLAGDCCSRCGNSDFNSDGDFGTDADIEAFFRVLAGGSC